MTVSSENGVKEWTGSGNNGPFTFDFQTTNDPSHILVTRIAADGTATNLVSPGDYQLTLVRDGKGGGRIYTTELLEAPVVLRAKRVLPKTQNKNLSNGAGPQLETIEAALDYLTMILQDTNTQTISLEDDGWDAGGFRIINVGTPAADDDAATAGWVNSRISDTLAGIAADTISVGFGDTIVMSQIGFGPSKTEAENTIALSAALTSIESKGGGTIVVDKAGISDCASVTKTMTAPLKIHGVAGAKIRGNNVDYASSAALLTIQGSSGTAAALTSAGIAGADQIVVDSPDQFTVGGFIMIRSALEVWNGISGVDGYGEVRKYELNIVVGKSGTTLTLAFPLASSYSITSGNSVAVTPLNMMPGFTMTGDIELIGAGELADLSNGQGQRGLRLDLIKDVNIYDVNATGWQGSVAYIFRSWDVNWSGGIFRGLLDRMPVDCFYGPVMDGCYHVKQHHADALYMRRPFDTGTTYITRHIEQYSNIANYMNGSAWGTHHCEFFDIHDNEGYHCSSVGALRGRNGKSHHNKYADYGAGGSGILIGSSNGLTNSSSGGTVTIEAEDIYTASGNAVKVSTSLDHLGIRGCRLVSTGSHPVYANGNKLLSADIRDNYMRTGTTNVNVHGIYIENPSSTMSDLTNIKIGRNQFENIYGSLIRIDAPTGTLGDNITIDEQDSNGTEAKNSGASAIRLIGTNFSPNVVIKPNEVAVRDHFMGASLSDVWSTYKGSDPDCAIAAPVALTDGGISMVAGNDAGSTMALNGTQINTSAFLLPTRGGLDFDIAFYISAITNLCLFAGFTDNPGSLEMPFTIGAGDVITPVATDAVGFLYDTNADTDNYWITGVKNGVMAASESLKNPTAGVVATISPSLIGTGLRRLRVRVGPTGLARFYVNDVRVGVDMVDAVTPSVNLCAYFGFFSRSTATKTATIDYLNVRQNGLRPYN